ncbi:MAG: hypothetical protein [Caudoviricetes sp.]|nr:MAG: hypothetical protein [Caudoviricetes sp.]
MSDLVIELKKPYIFEGEEFKVIDLSGLENLTGVDLIAAKKQFTQGGNFSAVLSVDPEYCAILAAKVLKQPDEFITYMPAHLYTKVTSRVTGFLNGGDE